MSTTPETSENTPPSSRMSGFDPGFPSSYLSPLQTALGNCWPRPRVRRIMEDLDNVQKRKTELQMRMNGIGKKPKEQRQAIWDGWVEEMNVLDMELQRLMGQFQKMPVTKEQFKRPNVALSECCDAYVRDTQVDPNGQTLVDPAHQCTECGSYCRTYTRLEREKWPEEYREEMADRKREQEQQEKDRKHLVETKQAIASAPAPGLKGGWLIT